jgi:hypothetical protein
MLATFSSLVLCFLYRFIFTLAADLKSFTVLGGRNSHSLAKLPYVHPPSVLLPQVWTIYWNFLEATDTLQYMQVSIHLQGYVPAFQFDHCHCTVHSELYICTSDIFTVKFTCCQFVSLSSLPVKCELLLMEPKVANVDRFHYYSITTTTTTTTTNNNNNNNNGSDR